MFNALLIEKDDAGYRASIKALDDDNLPEGDVTVRVDYSTLNYKDGLAITGKSPVVRKFPLVAGIDFAGTVEASSHAAWKAGDKVVLNGWGVGETHWGGLAQRARVKGDWLVRAARGLEHAPGHGHRHRRLHRHAVRDGAGRPRREARAAATSWSPAPTAAWAAWPSRCCPSWAIASSASTGRLHEADYLKQLGAAEVIDRAELSAPGKPLAKERWAGVVDAVGSHTLANACAGTQLPRRGGGLRPGAGHGLPGQRGALHPARHHAVRHRQRDGAAGQAPAGLAAAGARTWTWPSSTAWCTRSRWPARSPRPPTSWPARSAAAWW